MNHADPATTFDTPRAATPAAPPDPATLPTTLTLFLAMDERARVLKKLARHSRDRRLALLRALRVEPTPGFGASRDG